MNTTSADPRHAKVLVVITTRSRRGAEIDGMRLAASLQRHGHDTGVVALVPGAAGALPLPSLGRRALAPTTLWRLRRATKGFDVVVAHGSSTLPACAIALFASRRPFMYRSIGDPGAWAGGRLRRIRTGVLMRRAAHVVAIFPAAAASIRALYSVPTSRLSTIPNDRPIEHFTVPTTEQREAARSELGLAADDRMVCFIGSLSSEKRVDLAIRSAAAAQPCVLVVAGDGPDRRDGEALGEQLLPGMVRWLGSVDDVRSVLHAADALLLTSSTEGMPGVLIEAAMCGVPAVATDVGAVSELVQDGLTGRIVGDHDPAALASALRQVLDDRHRLGEAARQFASSNFDTGVVAARWSRTVDAVGLRD